MHNNLAPVIVAGALCVIGLLILWWMETHPPFRGFRREDDE